MFEIVEAIHKALRIESTWVFVLVIALGCSVVGGFFAWVIDEGYKNSSEYKESHLPPVVASQPVSSTAAVSTEQSASPPVVDAPVLQPLDPESLKIVTALADRFKASHKGQMPTYDWINKRLKKDARGFEVGPTPTAILHNVRLKNSGIANTSKGGDVFVIENTSISNNGTAIDNSEPNAKFYITKSQLDGNGTGILNHPDKPIPKQP